MLVYALVARGKTILAEITSQENISGNFEVIARVILSKLNEPNQPPRRSVELENHTFHILDDGELSFVVLTDRSVHSRTAFAFLSEVKQRFNSMFKPEDWRQAIAHSFNADFSGTLSIIISRYNQEQDDSQVRKVQDQLEEVKDVIRTNIDSLLNRGERIELLVDTTERLTQASFKFQESATRLKNQHWWQSKTNQIRLAVMLLIIIFLILVTSCGLDFTSC